MDHLRNILYENLNTDFFKNAFLLMTGNTLSQALPIIASPLLTRLYTPEQYGTLGLFTAIFTVFSVIATLRYELAIMLPEDDVDAINIFALAALITMGFCLLTLFIVYFCESQLVGLLNNPDISNWLYFVPLMIILIGLYNCLFYWVSRKKQFKKIALAEVARGGVKVGTQVGSAYLIPGIGTAGLITGVIAGQLTATVLIWIQAGKYIKHKFRSISKIGIIKQAKRYKNFPVINAPHALVNNLSDKLPIILLTSYFSNSVAGFYSLTLMVVNLPSIIISNALGQVFYQKISKSYSDGADLYPLVIKFAKALFMISILPFLLLFLFAPYLFGFVFGQEWNEAGVYTRIIVPWIFLKFIIAPLSYIPLTLGFQAKAFKIELLGIITSAVALVVGGVLQNVIITLFVLSLFNCLILSYGFIWILFISKTADTSINAKENE